MTSNETTMNQTEATRLIREVFEQPFDKARFGCFVRELLNEVDESKATRPSAGQYIPLSYRQHVQQYRRLATYADPDGQALDILLVQLKKSSGLERARGFIEGEKGEGRRERGVAWRLRLGRWAALRRGRLPLKATSGNIAV